MVAVKWKLSTFTTDIIEAKVKNTPPIYIKRLLSDSYVVKELREQLRGCMTIAFNQTLMVMDVPVAGVTI